MSNYNNFILSQKEKDDFFGFLFSSEVKTVNRTVTRVSGNDSVFEFALATPYSTTTATFTDAISLNQSGELAYNSSNKQTPADISISGIKWNAAGTRFYVCDSANSRINQYNCSTAYDISTAVYTSTFSTYGKEDEPRDLIFNTAGTTMIVLGSKGHYDQGITGPQLIQYTLSTGFDISTASFVKRATVGTDTEVKGLISNTAGTVFYVSGDQLNKTTSYTISSAFDVGSVVFLAEYDHSSSITNLRGIALNSAGTKLYGVNNSTNAILEYPLNTGFNLVSIQPTNATFTIRTNNINPKNITFNSDGSKMFITGDAGRFQIDAGEDGTPYTHLVKARNPMTFYEGYTYIFNVSSPTLLNHNFSFSTTNDGTFGGGVAYTTNVTTSGTIGNAAATVTIVVPKNSDSITAGSAVAPLFYFDNKHSKLGGSISTPEVKGQLTVYKTNFVDNIETRKRTALQEDIFYRSYIFNSGTDFQVVNGDLVINIT